MIFLVLAVISFGSHYVWESLHIPLYTGYAGLGGDMPVVLYATVGDVFYTLLVVGAFCVYKRQARWLRNPAHGDYIALAIAGLAIALFVEEKAALLGRWEYTAAMPTLWGFGLSPLLQMTILLPLSVYASAFILRRLRT